ncbi:Uncharacterised protein [Mycobacteroides abscessus subsp. abscessus]|nr:Uncharacterised protein [Mycobacteroides abscessus subsp. abscessus]
MAEEVGGDRGACGERLGAAQTGPGEQADLLEVLPMGSDPGVGAHGDADARLVRPDDRLVMGLDDGVGLVDDGLGQARPRLGGLDDGPRRLEGGGEERPVLEHEVDGLVVEVDPVFDRADPGPDGVLDPRRPLSVGHDVRSLGGRLGDDDGDLLLGELGVPGIVARGEHSPGRADLDVVGSRPQQLPGLAPDPVDAVGDAGGPSRVRGEERGVGAGDEVEVPVPAGLGHDRHGDRHPRSPDDAGIDGDLGAEVGPACVAHGRHPARERLLHVTDGGVERQREGVVEGRGAGRAGAHEVDVAVDDPGDEGALRAVDEGVRGVVGALPRLGDRRDPPTVDDDVTTARDEPGPVEDLRIREHCDHRQSPHHRCRLPHIYHVRRGRVMFTGSTP